MMFSNASIPIATAMNWIDTVAFGGLDLQPVYQRGYVWIDDFKDKLIYSIIKQYPIGSIYITTNEQNTAYGEVHGMFFLRIIYK